MLDFMVAAMIVATAWSQGGQPGAPAVDAKTVAPPVADTKAAFEKQLADVDVKMGAVVDLRATFEQRKTTALLKKPLVSKGTLVCKGESVLWKTTSPRESSMLVGPEKVTVYYPADKLAEEYLVGARFRDAAGGPLPRLSKLKERFEIAELSEAGLKAMGISSDEMKGRLGITLTPKDEQLRKHVASVRVILDTSVPCADRVVIVDPEGDETEIRFSEARINTGVKDSDLELALPQGTKVSKPLEGGK
jgi:hypothetical protein